MKIFCLIKFNAYKGKQPLMLLDYDPRYDFKKRVFTFMQPG